MDKNRALIIIMVTVVVAAAAVLALLLSLSAVFIASVLLIYAAAVSVIAAASISRTDVHAMMKRSDVERVVHEYRDIIVLLEEKNDYLISKWDSLEQSRRTHAKDLAVAKSIQRSILPREFPSSDHLRFAAHYQPIEGVGGDLYDVIALDRDRVIVVVADVAGHGVSSALIAAMLKASIASYAVRYPSPGILLARINKNLVQQITTAHFVTAVIAHFDNESGVLTYASAGHPKPLFRRGRSVSELPGSGPILGTFPNVSYKEETMMLCHGDKFVFYTDGVTDLSGHADKRETFGAERLISSFTKNATLDIAGIVSGITGDMNEYTRRADDDCTVLGVEMLRTPGATG